MDYLRTTEAELGIDLDRPLSEQDPLDRLELYGKHRKESMLMLLCFMKCPRNLLQPSTKKLKRVVSLLEGLQGGKKIALCQKE
ncbi:hypothetical protein Tco_0662952 [Tanacetum coccineum]